MKNENKSICSALKYQPFQKPGRTGKLPWFPKVKKNGGE